METEATDAGLRCAIEQFPGFATSIRDRFHDDQSFREMCGDYAETLEALQRWQASADPRRAARVQEYQDLAEALESEILAVLSASVLRREVDPA